MASIASGSSFIYLGHGTEVMELVDGVICPRIKKIPKHCTLSTLTKTGLANVTGWPGDGGIQSGTILKGGGYWNLNSLYTGGVAFQVSDRSFFGGTTLNQTVSNTKERSIGGRGVRNF